MLKLHKNYLNRIFIENEVGKLLETDLVSEEIDPKIASLNLNKHTAFIDYNNKVYNTGLDSKEVQKYFGRL